MRVAIFTNVSKEIENMARLTNLNKLEYCTRHNYSLIINNKPYEDAVAETKSLIGFFDMYDMLWTLDADTIITNMSLKIEELSCIGSHITVCEEGIVPWNLINCGSVVWKNTEETKQVLKAITENQSSWKNLICGWQTWLSINKQNLGDILTIAPLKSFNSCVWNKPGNGPGLPGSNWTEGDFVYHPCGVFPYESTRIEYIKEALKKVI